MQKAKIINKKRIAYYKKYNPSIRQTLLESNII